MGKPIGASSAKQKTLLSFFGPGQGPSKLSSSFSMDATQSEPKMSAPAVPNPSAEFQVDYKPTETKKERPHAAQLPSATKGGPRSRAVSESSITAKNAPPESDIIMCGDSDEVEEEYRPTRLKRKLVIDSETETENSPAFKKKLAANSSSPPTDGKKRKNTGKPRPAKRRKTTDEDDFIAPSDEDSEPDIIGLQSEAESHSTKSTSRRSSVMEIDEDDEEIVKQSKPKGRSGAKPAKRPTPPETRTGSSSTGIGLLTAAERRVQTKKDEKKDAEQPYSFLQDTKDKDGVRPGEEGYDPRTLYIPNDAWKTFTPFEVQFWEIKQNHYDTILFFQKGKFYELYEDDARVGHQIFDLKLTSRVKMCMVGVPESSFSFWASKFLAKGYKVGKVEQVETALGAEMRVAASKGKGTKTAEKGLVRRVLNKVFTNGTLVDGDFLVDEEAGHCISIREQGENAFGLAILDSSTSEFNLSAFIDDVCRTKLETILRQLRPKELVYSKGNLTIATSRLLKTLLPGRCIWTCLRTVEGYDYEATLKELKELYPPKEDDENAVADLPEAIHGLVDNECAIVALGAMIWYLRQLNIDKALLSARNFNIYDPLRKGQALLLDGQTLAHIEVLLNSEGTEDGTLHHLLGRCITPYGKRLFRIWLCNPLRDINAINDRLDAIEELMQDKEYEFRFSKMTKGLPDLERVVSRIHAGSCKIRDFLKVLEAFKKIDEVVSDLADYAARQDNKTILGHLRESPSLAEYIEKIYSQFVNPTGGDATELVPQSGMDEEFDTIEKEIGEIESELERELRKIAKKLNLKLSFWHSNLGQKDIYLAQVPTENVKSVPKDWLKSGGTKAFTRYQVPEFASSIRALKEARENRTTAIKGFTSRLYAIFDQDRDIWLRAVRKTAEFDCLLSLAKSSAAIGSPSCRPTLLDSDAAFVEFEELRHPGIAATNENFIANDVKMGQKVARIMLLTGPNMAGKSTLMRQTCVAVIMAQLGMYVPAQSATLSPVDAILTRMGAYDNMFSNSSTFKVELDECSKIIKQATPKSLIVMDELGRGTSTYDGIAIASAVLHHLATHTLALSCFATHYSMLTEDYRYHPNIRTMHMATAFDDDQRALVWLYKLVEGVAPSSFGTHVASLAGVPASVVMRADTVSEDFARQFAARLANRRIGKIPVTTQADFAFLAKLVEGMLTLDGDPMRRREILQVIKKGALAQFKAAENA